MDGVTSGLHRRREDGRQVEVAVRRAGRANAHRPGGQLYMERLRIGRGVDGHGLDLHLPAGTDDADGDLSPVGDQDPMEHRLTAP